MSCKVIARQRPYRGQFSVQKSVSFVTVLCAQRLSPIIDMLGEISDPGVLGGPEEADNRLGRSTL